MELERRTYTVAEAATVLGLGRNAVYEAVSRGEVPHIRVGGRIIIPKDRFEQWLAGDEHVVRAGSVRLDALPSSSSA